MLQIDILRLHARAVGGGGDGRRLAFTFVAQRVPGAERILDKPPDVALSPDPKDNPIPAAAIAGKADLIVSRDKMRIPMRLATYSDLKAATHSDLMPAGVPT